MFAIGLCWQASSNKLFKLAKLPTTGKLSTCLVKVVPVAPEAEIDGKSKNDAIKQSRTSFFHIKITSSNYL
jgi:hypothetical protein